VDRFSVSVADLGWQNGIKNWRLKTARTSVRPTAWPLGCSWLCQVSGMIKTIAGAPSELEGQAEIHPLTSKTNVLTEFPEA
jgi:hypothetical protein